MFGCFLLTIFQVKNHFKHLENEWVTYDRLVCRSCHMIITKYQYFFTCRLLYNSNISTEFRCDDFHIKIFFWQNTVEYFTNFFTHTITRWCCIRCRRWCRLYPRLRCVCHFCRNFHLIYTTLSFFLDSYSAIQLISLF